MRPRPIHARDIRYSRDVTLCLRKAPGNSVDDPVLATCEFCRTIWRQRERTYGRMNQPYSKRSDFT